MVERLKAAIEKARAHRETEATRSPVPTTPSSLKQSDWAALTPFVMTPLHCERHHLLVGESSDPIASLLDTFRTRLLKQCHGLRWTRIGVTSAHKSAGKTLITVNLGFSFARRPDVHTLVVDLDMRAPAVARRLGIEDAEPLCTALRGDTDPISHVRCFEGRLAFCLNGQAERHSARLLHSASAPKALDTLINGLRPTLTLFDMPPLLGGDDALASLEMLDGVILVVDATTTSPRQVEECLKALGNGERMLGVLINRAEGRVTEAYAYGPEAA